MDFLRAFKPIVFDLISTIVFVTVLWLTNNVVLATVAGIAIGVARFVWMKVRGQTIGPLQYLSIALVLVTGITTIVTANPIFVMLKSSLAGFAVAGVMLTSNWMAPYLPPAARDNLDPRVVWWSSKLWGVLFVVLGAVNAFIAIVYGLKTWTWFAAFVPATVHVSAFVLQYIVFRSLIRRRIRATSRAAAVQPSAV